MPTPPKSHRRDFLRGQAAIQAVENFADGYRAETVAATDAQPASQAESTYLLHFGRDAMAVEFQIYLNAGESEQGPEAAVKALDLIEKLEAQLTVYRDSSEVSRINRAAYESPIAVESRLFRLFQSAVRISADTDGAYDMTAGPLSKVWGFYRRQGRMPGDEEIAAALQQVGYRHLDLDATSGTIRFLRPGMELNLGGIGKGYALDRAAELLTLDNSHDFLLHGGNSSVLARGSRAGSGENGGWSVGLAHPLRPEVRLAEFRLRHRALGTSGSGTQFFHYQGKKYGHILDPRTGRPADRVLSSTVIAPTAAEADALSTAFYVLGREGAEGYCRTHPQIAALLVVPKLKAGELELLPLNLSEHDWQRLS